jgi:hypothetical protein
MHLERQLAEESATNKIKKMKKIKKIKKGGGLHAPWAAVSRGVGRAQLQWGRYVLLMCC